MTRGRHLLEGLKFRFGEGQFMRVIDKAEVREKLTYERCIPLVRNAMMAFSRGDSRQLMRTRISLADSRMLGVMPGALGEADYFGAKLVSVNPTNYEKGLSSHMGVVVLFDKETGDVACVVDAGEVTAIRTAAASALATDALAAPEASTLALFGYGEQAHTHAVAISKVRNLKKIVVWGRRVDRAQAFADKLAKELGVPAEATESGQDAAAQADIICTVSASETPILKGEWVKPGTHVNVVGSSFAGPTEVDSDLVVRSRFIADSREHVLQQGAEFLYAKQAGLVGDDHIAAEIGEVLLGTKEGRQSADQITVYKSLGHVVQDLAAAQALYEAP
jgi:ornithine cyclodeaminase/alanine dehydrogenase-like protein (mu-crystallin family)